MSEDRLTQLERRLAAAEGRIAQLESAGRSYGPVTQPVQFGPNQCGKCGIKLEGVMMYCCPHGDCPCGLGGISCTVLSPLLSQNGK